MKDRTKQILVKVGAFLFAVAMIVTVSIMSRNTMLKAAEDEAAVEVVKEKADAAPEVPPKKEEVKKEEPKAEEPKKEEPKAEEPKNEEKPAEKDEKTEEIPISEIEEEEEEEFDVKKAYKKYMSLSESEQDKYLDSLSPENRSDLLKYIKKMEAKQADEQEEINEELEKSTVEENAAETVATEEPKPEEPTKEEPKTENPVAEEPTETNEEEIPAEEPEKTIDYSKLKVSFTSDHAGKKAKIGETINLKAKLEGFEGLDYTVFWEYSDDGGKTYKTDGQGLTHSVVASEENSGWIWRINVILN